MSENKQRMKYCFNCGEELGLAPSFDREPDSCGKAECDRELRWQLADERDAAHEQLDRDRGWRHDA